MHHSNPLYHPRAIGRDIDSATANVVKFKHLNLDITLPTHRFYQVNHDEPLESLRDTLDIPLTVTNQESGTVYVGFFNIECLDTIIAPLDLYVVCENLQKHLINRMIEEKYLIEEGRNFGREGTVKFVPGLNPSDLTAALAGTNGQLQPTQRNQPTPRSSIRQNSLTLILSRSTSVFLQFADGPEFIQPHGPEGLPIKANLQGRPMVGHIYLRREMSQAMLLTFLQISGTVDKNGDKLCADIEQVFNQNFPFFEGALTDVELA